MIKKISKILNLGIFYDYQWDSNLPEFKRFNLIYGWNGSGKTILSQLLAALESGKTETHPELEYKIQSDSGEFTQNTEYNKQIRVFNQDYIADNIDISSGKAKPIFILGKENKELVKIIKEDEKTLKGDPDKKDDIGKIKELELKKKEIDRNEIERRKCFTNVAKVISTNTSGVSARNYRKNNAEQAFAHLKVKNILEESKIKDFAFTLKQLEKPALSELLIDTLSNRLEKVAANAKSLLNLTVETVIIDRLKENPDLSNWVEKGISLHEEMNSENCEFCNRPLPPKRIPELLTYFNEADKKLKDDIDILINDITRIYETIEGYTVLDKANLYNELQSEYVLVVETFTKSKNDLLNNISKLKEEIENKKTKTTVSLELPAFISTTSFSSAVLAVNTVIIKHNKKTDNFTQAKKEATNKLENHYLSEMFDEIKSIDSDITKLNKEVNFLENGVPEDPAKPGITQLKQRIIENKTKISTSGPACEEINKQLKTFLGRNELTFEVTDGGYLIQRAGKIAKNLSEGEKTAIAFVYFTIHLKDQEFKVNDGIIVVDDPICSLDSNSLFQAFSFLKNAVRDASQVFILTHNFDFLKLLLNWLKNYPKNKGGKEFYMIKNPFNDSNRVAKLDILDTLLQSYESEYQYLFKNLFEFKSDGTLASVFHIPNIARKVLEYFLMIMIPNSKSMYNKLELLEFDENKKTAIYKFTNDQSHITGNGFDPSLVPECQNNVKYLIEMIETVFPSHHKVLVESINTGGQN